MEITKERRGDFTVLKAAGRLDEHWSTHLANFLDETIREGARRIWFDMSKVTYLSSAGIGVLVLYYKQLAEIDGSFTVTQPSPAVQKILELTHLSPILLVNREVQAGTTDPRVTRSIEHDSTVFKIVDLAPGSAFECTVVGDPSLLPKAGYAAKHARPVVFRDNLFGIGLGAFGSDFDDCRTRYGEFIAVAGAAAYLPADGSSVPDYMISAGSLVPELSVLNAILCEGKFASVAEFDASEREQVIRLGDIAGAALEIAGAEEAAMVIIAETAGLVGAALRKSPAAGGSTENEIFAHPEIRNWLSFTSEPAYAGSLCIVAGVVSRRIDSRLAPVLRPLSTKPLNGHFHAAACRYRPTRKGAIDLNAAVKSLIESQSLQGVLHLISDLRQSGPSESEFVRGACWVGPIDDVEIEPV